METDKRPVITLHGILMPAAIMNRVNAYLLEAGYSVYGFGYPSRKLSVPECAQRLAEYIDANNIQKADFVAHSMGGLIVQQFLTNYEFPESRTVALGSPFQGSKVARAMSSRSWQRFILGKHTEGELLHGLDKWPDHHELGVVAGNSPLSLGRLMTHITKPHDGTVSVAETKLPGMKEHTCIAIGHTALVFSVEAIELSKRFLQTGSFEKSS